MSNSSSIAPYITPKGAQKAARSFKKPKIYMFFSDGADFYIEVVAFVAFEHQKRRKSAGGFRISPGPLETIYGAFAP